MASSVPERSPGAEGLAVGADFVVLDGQGRMLRGLNATGADVWALIDGHRSLEAIALQLAGKYAQPPARVLEDVIAFARELLAKDLIRLREGA